MVHLNIVMRVRSVGHFLVTFVGRLSGSLVNVVAILIRFRISIAMVFLLNMDGSRAVSITMTIARLSRSFVDVVSILIRFRISISMVFLLNMDISRSITMTISISRSSRPLAISMMVSFRMVNLNLVVRIRPVHILIAIATMAVAWLSFSRSFFVIMFNFISI